MFPGGECAAVPGRDMAAPQAAGWSPRPSSGCNANQAFYFLLIRESQPAIRAWLRDGPCAGGTVREARDHGPEMVAAIAAPGEAGGMAFGVVEAGLPVGSNDRAPDVSKQGVDPFEGRHAGRPAPGTGADRPVVAAGTAEGGPAGEGVGRDLGVGGESRPALWAACGPALAEASDGDRLGLARSAFGTRPRTASCRVRPVSAYPRTHAAGMGVVHPHPPRQGLFPLALVSRI